MIIPTALLCYAGQSCAQIYDRLCMQTGRKCGHNMAYRTVDRLEYTDDVSPELICIQECACISEQYEKRDGQCIEKNNNSTRNKAELPIEVPTLKVCSGRICRLDEIITDTLCLLTDQKCGPNMVFKTTVGPLRMKVGISSYQMCIQQCTCDSNEYTKMGGQCIKKSSAPMRNETEFGGEILPKHCTGRVCALDEEIFNVPCSLTGEICGTNMIFNNIGKFLKKNGTEVCIQKCTCMSEEYVKANGQCILPAEGNEIASPSLIQQSAEGNESVIPISTQQSTEGNESLTPTSTQQSAEGNESLSETPANCVGLSCGKIRDPFCMRTGWKCGDNMLYTTVERLVYIDDSPEICIQQCKCVSEEYIEKDGQCIKQERKVTRKATTRDRHWYAKYRKNMSSYLVPPSPDKKIKD
ncbi:unnamed protein product [Dracunculus medinensis]|uniref:Submaxillary mucin-like protein n=1 Tax=Dracunculus medinensis TaxID=318479 RepID=A0A0N4UQY3_DRAME|nr:unnamed protein product [Dracunculus medinensis]